MKKFVKMSLVAAVAVAGLTTANATNLEEAIKGVDISGTMVYRLNSYEAGASNTANTNYYKLAVNVSSPINDDMKANIGVVSGNQANGDKVTLANAEGNADIFLTKANFSYSGITNTTVIVGKQGITTPFSTGVDSDGKINTGTGILALTNVGPVTLAGAVFNAINDDTFGTNGEDLAAAAAIAKVGPVALDLWVANLSDTFSAYSIGAKASFDVDAVKVTVDARHTALDAEIGAGSAGATLGMNATNDENSLSKIMVSAKMGIFNAYLGYGSTGKEGGTVTLANGVTSAAAEMVSWSTFLSTKADSDMIMVGAGAQVTPELNAAIKYAAIDNNTVNDNEEETYFEGKWTPSKNFYAYLRAGQYTSAAGVDSDRARVQVQYSF